MEDTNDIKLVDGYQHIRYYKESYDEDEILSKSKDYLDWLNGRRTVRDFSNKPVPKEVIENILMSASTAPSGAHKQPWTFCVVSNPEMKAKIREAAENEEHESYHNRMSEEWLNDLKPIGTDWHKPFLEIAPYLVIVFKKAYDKDDSGQKKNNYYVNESVGLAC